MHQLLAADCGLHAQVVSVGVDAQGNINADELAKKAEQHKDK